MATTSEILSVIRRKEARGQNVSDRFVRNLFAAELDVEKGRALEGERLATQKSQFARTSEARDRLREQQSAEAEKARKAEGRASAISGVAQIGFLGAAGKAQLDTAAAAKITAETGAFATGAETGAFVPGTTGVGVTGTGGVAGLTTGATEAAVVGTEATTAAAGAEAGIGAALAPLAAGAVGKFGTEALGANQELSNVAGGAAAGAVIGSQIGSVGGPPGALIGAVVGFVGGEVADTIICTELNRQGYMPKEMLELEHDFKEQHISPQVYAGYIKIASPIVRLMRKSWLFTQLVRAFAMPWGYQMCHMVKPDKYKFNIIGEMVMKIGIPLCRCVGGKLIKEVA